MIRFFIRGADGQPHQILLYDVIGSFFWEDSVTAKMILSALAEVGPDEEILVRINCQGGDHEDGTAIYNALASHPGKVTMRVEGYACSMATAVMCAGDSVEMYETALLMLHRASTHIYGNANELLAAAEMLEKADHSLATAYSRKTGKKVDEVLALLDEKRDTWLTPDEAKELGLVDEIIVPQKFTALLDKQAITALAEDEGAALLASKYLPKTLKAALEGVPGAVAFHIDGNKIEPIKAQAESSPEAETTPPPADVPPADDPQDPPGGNPPEGDEPPAGDETSEEEGEEEEQEDPPSDPPPPPEPDAVALERARVKAIRAQAKKCGVPADSELVDNLIDDGHDEATAGKLLLAFKQSLQQTNAIHGNHSSGQEPETRKKQVQASWSGVYDNLNRKRR